MDLCSSFKESHTCCSLPTSSSFSLRNFCLSTLNSVIYKTWCKQNRFCFFSKQTVSCISRKTSYTLTDLFRFGNYFDTNVNFNWFLAFGWSDRVQIWLVFSVFRPYQTQAINCFFLNFFRTYTNSCINFFINPVLIKLNIFLSDIFIKVSNCHQVLDSNKMRAYIFFYLLNVLLMPRAGVF